MYEQSLNVYVYRARARESLQQSPLPSTIVRCVLVPFTQIFRRFQQISHSTLKKMFTTHGEATQVSNYGVDELSSCTYTFTKLESLHACYARNTTYFTFYKNND